MVSSLSSFVTVALLIIGNHFYSSPGGSNSRPGGSAGNNNLPPSYSPPSRSFFTPPLPPEYQNPFADKPTLRGTPNENQLLLQPGQSPAGIDYTSHHTALNRGRPNLPPPPPVQQPQQPFEKKVLNTPSNSGGVQSSSVLVNQLNSFLLSTTAHPGIQNHSHQSSGGGGGGSGSGSSNSVLHIPSISRILSGSNGRKEDFPEVLLRKATIKPSIGKMHTTTVKIARNTTQQQSSAASSSSSSQGTTTARSFPGMIGGGGGEGEGIEESTEEIELDEQLNKNLLVLLQNNKNGGENGDGGAAGSEMGDNGVLMEPSDRNGGGSKEFDKHFSGGDNLWSILWNFHIYLTAILFTIISVYSIFKIIFYDKLIYLFSQKFFLMIYCLIIMISLIRIYYLCYDPYNINASFNYLLNDFFLNFPQFLMTVLLVLLIYYLIVKIYFNDLLMLVRGGDWDDRLSSGGADRGGLMDEHGDEERGGQPPVGDHFKRISLDKKNKIVLVDAGGGGVGVNINNSSNNSNEDNQTATSDEPANINNARGEEEPATNNSSPDTDHQNYYLSSEEKHQQQQQEKELEYGFFLVYFLKNFYKKNARFFHIVLALNILLLLVFVTLFVVFYVKLRLSFNANLLLVFVKCFVQFLNLNLILVYFHIYKKLKHVLNRFKMRIINVMNSCGPDVAATGNHHLHHHHHHQGGMLLTGDASDKFGVVGGGNSNSYNNNNNKKIMMSDSHEGNLTSSGVSGNGSSGDSHGTGSDGSQATYSRAILGGGGGSGTNGGSGVNDANSNTNLVQTFQRTFNRMNYLVFIKNLFNAINITIGIIMLYLLFIIINLLYFVYYYYYYYANAGGRMESSDLQHNNLIFDKEKLNNIFLIKFNWLEWSYQFSNRLIELTILILFIWALNIKFVSTSKRFFSGGGGSVAGQQQGKKGGVGGSPGHHMHHMHHHHHNGRDEMIDNENFILNLNLNKHQVVSYNTNNNQVEFNTNSPMMGGGQTAPALSSDDVLMDNEYENPINIYQQLANSQQQQQRGPAYYGVNKHYQGYYQEPVGAVPPQMMMNPSNTTMFNSINVRNNEFRASKNLKQFKSTNSLSTNNLNSNSSCNNNNNNNSNAPTVMMNNYRPPQAQPQHYQHNQQQQQMHPGGGGGGVGGPGPHNFYDVINPSPGSNYYYSLRNPSSHHSMAAMMENGSDGTASGGHGEVGGGYGDHGESAYQARSMKKGGGHTTKNRTRRKKSNPGHRHGGDPQAMMDQGILPGLITQQQPHDHAVVDTNNFDYESEVAKRGSGNKMLVDDNGFVRFKEFEERNNDSGIIMGGGGAEYGEQQQQHSPGQYQHHQHPQGLLEGMGSKRSYSHQRTPYHQQQQQQQHYEGGRTPSSQHPSSHELNDFFGAASDNGNVLCREN